LLLLPPPLESDFEFEPEPSRVSARVTSTNTIDELEDLLNGLEDTTQRASIRVAPAKAQPQSTKANSSSLSMAVTPPSAPAPRPTSVASRPAASNNSSFLNNNYSAPNDNYGNGSFINNNYSSPAPPANNYSSPANNYSSPANNYSTPANNNVSNGSFINNYSAPPANNYSSPASNSNSGNSFMNNYSAPPANNYSANNNYSSSPASNNYSAQANNKFAPPANNYANNNYSAPAASNGFGNSYAKPAAAPPTNSYSKPEPRPYSAKPPAVRPPLDNSIDILLGDLQNQLRAEPDPSAPAHHGACASCTKPILGEVISALGKRFHPEHFVCGNCMMPLGTSNFYEQDGVPYDERCYQELLCPRCAHCDEPILERCVTALGKKWHMDHFICTQCLRPFDNGTFFERDSRPYCEGCFATAFAPRCGGCNQPVRGECINALGSAWHPEHFVCQYCQKTFTGSFYDFGGKPYCDVHYHQQAGSLCAGCGKAVAGKCIDALGKKWHPEHFVCAFCMNTLAAGAFTENGNKAYCRDCHGKLFG